MESSVEFFLGTDAAYLAPVAEHIGAHIVFVRPDDGAAVRRYPLKDGGVSQCLLPWATRLIDHCTQIDLTHKTVAKDQLQTVFAQPAHAFDSIQVSHGLSVSQRINPKRRLSIPHPLPVLVDFSPMEVEPFLHHSPSPGRQASRQNVAGFDFDCNFVFPVTRMEMRWQMVSWIDVDHNSEEL